MTTVITHIYNEEFLLPYWLKHHTAIFDHGIVIDYGSTDSSIDIVKELAPSWKIVDSPTEEFDSDALDRFIEVLEKDLEGPRIALTITEFFIGNPVLVRNQIIVPEISLINQEHDAPFIVETPIHLQRNWGLISNTYYVTNNSFYFPKGNGRSLHTHSIKYPPARHFIPVMPSPFLIIRVNDCLFSPEMFRRRLQIQSRIPRTDIEKNYSIEHTNFGKGLTEFDLEVRQENQRKISVFLGDIIVKALERQKITSNLLASGKLTFDESELLFDAVNSFRYPGESQVYTAATSFEEEISYVRKSYESSPAFKITHPFRIIYHSIKKRLARR